MNGRLVKYRCLAIIWSLQCVIFFFNSETVKSFPPTLLCLLLVYNSNGAPEYLQILIIPVSVVNWMALKAPLL